MPRRCWIRRHFAADSRRRRLANASFALDNCPMLAFTRHGKAPALSLTIMAYGGNEEIDLENQSGIAVTGNPDYEEEPFTAFSSVTPDTRLELLNLNWRERDLPEHERTKHVHRLHPYLGKFVPQLVEIFLRKYAPRTVLDPFSGCGTTLVEANCLGIDAIGCDVSAFNTLLTGVKTARYDLDLLRREILDIVERVRLALQPGLFHSEPKDCQNSYLQTWLHPSALRELMCYQQLISEYHHQTVLQVILTRSARSSRLTTHSDLDFPKRPQTEPYDCRKHNRVCQPTDSAFKFLVRYSQDTIKRIEKFATLQTDARVHVLSEDSRTASFPEHDAVVTSPPYVGLIDYHKQHQYAYELLGLTCRSDQEIGPASKGTSKNAVASYVEGMTAVFSNVQKYLRPGGVMVVVVHDSRNLYDEIGTKLGVTTEFRFRRHVNRRTGRRSGAFFEDVIIWKKEKNLNARFTTS